MTAEIHSLGAPIVQSDVKAEFLRHVEAAFDDYVASTGKEPTAILHMLGGPHEDENRSLGWHLTGSAAGYASAWLALAAAELQAEFGRP